MVSLKFVVLLSCICVALNADELENLQKSCMKIFKDHVGDGYRRHIRPIIIPQRQAQWEMPLPSCLGESGYEGVEALVCDEENIPQVKFTEPNNIHVRRTGSMDSFIVVLLTLHCKTPQNQ